MENNNFDTKKEFNQKPAQKENKKGSFFKNLFSKSKKEPVDLPDYSLDENDSLDQAFEHGFASHNSEFNQDQFDLNIDNEDFDFEKNDFDYSNQEQALDQNQSSEEPEMYSNSSPRVAKASSATKVLKIIAVVLILSIIFLLGYFFLNSSSTPETVQNDTPSAITTQATSDVNEKKKLNETAVNQSGEVAAITSDTTSASQVESPDTNKNSPADLATPPSTTTDIAVKPVDETKETSTLDVDKNTNNNEAKKILDAAIPEDKALVKEEIDKLEDKNTRLDKQEELLTQRVEMMGQLTDKKAEQIALLEKQLAQLEAETGSK